MKIIKYITFSFALAFSITACEKHELLYNTEPVTDDMAEFQLHYFEPIRNVAANYIDSVFVNDVLYSSVDGSGQLLPYNGVPGGATGRFFSTKVGVNNFKFYRGSQIVYNQDVTLSPGKQNVFVHNLNQPPIVVDNQFPYWNPSVTNATIESFNTDSIASVMFCNFLYEDAVTPYQGKLQYQWKDPRSTTEEIIWHNVGSPVGFGEVTVRETIKIVKTVFNSSGSCRIDYRILDENGNVLKVCNTGGNMIDYSDWWTGYIGRSYMHIFSGIRTASTPNAAVKVWTSL